MGWANLGGLILFTPQTLGHNINTSCKGKYLVKASSSNANFKYSNFEPIKSALA